MDKTGKVLVSFNVKNGQYALSTGSPKPLTWMTSFAKEKNLTTKTINGDGELQCSLVNDKGFTGTLGLTAQDLEYNKDLGFMRTIDGGLAEIKQISVVEHSLYFETEYMGKDGVSKKKKVWVFGVEASAPSETLSQNTDDINESTVEYSITIKGVPLKTADGTANYVDPTSGQEIKCFTYSKIPTDTGYSTFENSVPVPKVAETVTISATAGSNGSVSPSSITVTKGSTVTISGGTLTCDGKTITATPSSGYEVDSWSGLSNNASVSSNTSVSVSFAASSTT